jgi:hypothetical protein
LTDARKGLLRALSRGSALIAPNPLLNASFGSALPATAAHPSRQLLKLSTMELAAR